MALFTFEMFDKIMRAMRLSMHGEYIFLYKEWNPINSMTFLHVISKSFRFFNLITDEFV